MESNAAIPIWQLEGRERAHCSGRGANSDLSRAQVRPRIKGACAVAAGAVPAVWPPLALGY